MHVCLLHYVYFQRATNLHRSLVFQHPVAFEAFVACTMLRILLVSGVQWEAQIIDHLLEKTERKVWEF